MLSPSVFPERSRGCKALSCTKSRMTLLKQAKRLHLLPQIIANPGEFGAHDPTLLTPVLARWRATEHANHHADSSLPFPFCSLPARGCRDQSKPDPRSFMRRSTLSRRLRSLSWLHVELMMLALLQGVVLANLIGLF